MSLSTHDDSALCCGHQTGEDLQGTYGIRIDYSVFDLRKRPSRYGKESYPPKIMVKKRASRVGCNAGNGSGFKIQQPATALPFDHRCALLALAD